MYIPLSPFRLPSCLPQSFSRPLHLYQLPIQRQRLLTQLPFDFTLKAALTRQPFLSLSYRLTRCLPLQGQAFPNAYDGLPLQLHSPPFHQPSSNDYDNPSATYSLYHPIKSITRPPLPISIPSTTTTTTSQEPQRSAPILPTLRPQTASNAHPTPPTLPTSWVQGFALRLIRPVTTICAENQ